MLQARQITGCTFQSAEVQQLDPVYPLGTTKEIEQKKAQTTKEKSISRTWLAMETLGAFSKRCEI